MSQNTVKERPILMSGPMVRAILDGRKSQTRRVVKIRPTDGGGTPTGYPRVSVGRYSPRPEEFDPPLFGAMFRSDLGGELLVACPFGQPGERLWVREAWVELLAVSPASDQPLPLRPGDRLIEPPTQRPDGGWYYSGRVLSYRADGEVEFCDGDGFTGDMADRSDMPRWRPSIHMPRWASRLLLEISEIRVQRVQEITPADAMAEGALLEEDGWHNPDIWFRDVWDTLNAKRGFGWETNSWVWAISFRVVEGVSR